MSTNSARNIDKRNRITTNNVQASVPESNEREREREQKFDTMMCVCDYFLSLRLSRVYTQTFFKLMKNATLFAVAKEYSTYLTLSAHLFDICNFSIVLNRCVHSWEEKDKKLHHSIASRVNSACYKGRTNTNMYTCYYSKRIELKNVSASVNLYTRLRLAFSNRIIL